MNENYEQIQCAEGQGAEKVHLLKESKTEAVGIAIERGRATRVNKKPKRRRQQTKN